VKVLFFICQSYAHSLSIFLQKNKENSFGFFPPSETLSVMDKNPHLIASSLASKKMQEMQATAF